ncbi:MAG: ZIP family metal transporter [Thermoleophilaceae bacterium]
MSLAETVALGALAGLTIYLGLPFGRIQLLGRRSRVALAMFSVGVLAFLFVDIFEHAFEIVEEAVQGYRHGKQGSGEALGFLLLLGGGFALGSAGLATIESRLRGRNAKPAPVAGGSGEAAALNPGETLALEADARARALQVGMTIAVAIGLHNFAEGLAIGVSASTGEIGLATVLIVGFALHNATEGFGILGPLGAVQPSWRWIGLAGLVGGGPVFLGSIVGYNVTSQPLELAFYGISGGAILYVIGEVWTAVRRHGHRELGLWLLALGFFAGVLTDMLVVYGGA